MSCVFDNSIKDQTLTIALCDLQSNKSKGGRPKKKISNPNDPIYKQFLSLFGLNYWDDTKTWTQEELIVNGALKNYFQMRDLMLTLCYPMNYIRKIKVKNPDQFTAKDLITLLNQFGKLYGYCVISYTKEIKPNKTNGLTKKKCYQVYSLSKIQRANICQQNI